MRLSKRQQQLIESMVREEAERTVSGRELAGGTLQEVGPDINRVRDTVATTSIQDAAYEAGITWVENNGVQLVQNVENLVFKTAGRNAAGGPMAPGMIDRTTFENIMEYAQDEFGHLEMELHDAIARAVENYAVKMMKLVMTMAEEDPEVWD